MCIMNVIRYYIHLVVIVMWPTTVSCVTSLPFTNPVMWLHGIVKCSLDAHFRYLRVFVAYLHWTNSVNSDIILVHILFSPYYVVGKYVILDSSYWQPLKIFRMLDLLITSASCGRHVPPSSSGWVVLLPLSVFSFHSFKLLSSYNSKAIYSFSTLG